MTTLPKDQGVSSSQRTRAKRVVVAGLGSAFGDDYAGWYVCKRLLERLSKLQDNEVGSIRVITLRSPAEILDCLEHTDELHLIDACQGHRAKGMVYRFAWPTDQLAEVEFSGTHDFGPRYVLQLASSLGMLPQSVRLWGVEIGADPSNQAAMQLSAAVQQGATMVVDSLLTELGL